jgi:hypothetical protein
MIRNYEPKSLISVVYMGGDVVFPKSEKFFVCSCDETANIIDYETSELLSSFKGVKFLKIDTFKGQLHYFTFFKPKWKIFSNVLQKSKHFYLESFRKVKIPFYSSNLEK